MPTAHLPDINFESIRPHSNSRHGGFEELSVQLFRSDVADFVDFTRVEGAGGDGGVEAFATLRDGKEIGLQAKFFATLQAKQWQQIDGSVRSALDHHPRLLEYRVVVPLNRTPQNKNKWDANVRLWQTCAKQKGIRHKIRFVWWGAFELQDLLTTPTHNTKLLYWFGCRQFSDEWIDRHNECTIADLDCRYTPKRHVRTESEALLDAFSLTERFVADFYQRVKAVFDASRKLNHAIETEKLQQAALPERNAYADALLKTRDGFGNGKTIPSYKALSFSCNLLRVAGEKLLRRINELNRLEKLASTHEATSWHQGPLEYPLSLARRFLAHLDDISQFLERFVCADHRRLLVVGPAGSGKSHLLATAVLEARKRREPALILLGEHFLASDEPWTQLVAKLGWEGSITELLSALDHSAEVCGQPALLCIDALNESAERALWRSHLNSFAQRMKPFSHVRLLVSCRNDFEQITLPDMIRKRTDRAWAVIEHLGFGDELFQAVGTYFSGYGIQADHFPPLLEEFQNPLFLKTFSEAFENSRLPSGPITLDMVMRQRMSKICEKLARDIDCPKEVTLKSIELVAGAIESNQGRAVPKDETRLQVDALFKGGSDSKSLYRHLRSNGILVEVGSGYGELDSETEVSVRFSYERFSEYFIADKMLRPYRDAQDLKSAWTDDGTLNRINQRSEFWEHRGLMRAFAILFPERFGIEFAELVKTREIGREVFEDFLASLPWRNPASFSRRSHQIFQAAQGLGFRDFLQAILRVSTVPGHPYNANYLHARLKEMKLPVRDRIWTSEISELTVSFGQSVPDLLVKWAFHVPPHLVSDEQALLVARVLAWFFSTNHRAFRLRATLAAIRLLQGRCEQVISLVEDFYDCNDPYVVERVVAVACGVAMREKNPDALRKLGATIYSLIFATKTILPNILTRDYAQCILELANHRGCLPEPARLQDFRPPFLSKWPRILSERQVKAIEQKEGWQTIKSSVQPEAAGWYGDFGRYVMQSAVHQFSAIPLTRRFTRSHSETRFNAMTARRWVLQRVKQLGWTAERFQRYERSLPSGRHRVDIEELRAERVSKKYQWIALRELLGFLSDHYYLTPDWGQRETKSFQGAWQLWARDFDPSQPLRDLPDNDVTDAADTLRGVRPWWNSYPDPFADEHLVANREAWVVAPPDDFRPLIELRSVSEPVGEFLALAGYYDWREELLYNTAESEVGQLAMWTHIRTWLVRRKDLGCFLSRIRDLHFWGHGIHLVGLGRGWLGEYPWGGVHRDLRRYCEERDIWLESVNVRTVQAVCHQDEKISGIFPSPQLCEMLNVSWAGKDFDFVDNEGKLVAFSPLVDRNLGSPPCIVSREKLIEAVRRTGWEVVWGVLGERSCYSSESHRHIVPKAVQFSGVFHLANDKVVGGLTKHLVLRLPRP